jgi:hypothetical protein
MGILAWGAAAACICGNGDACLARYATTGGSSSQHRQYGNRLQQGFSGAMMHTVRLTVACIKLGGLTYLLNWIKVSIDSS